MNDYRSAFNAMAADIGAIIALLGFSKYPGVDPVLRAITDLVLAKAETEGLRAERDVALAAVAQLHSMLGVTDQVQAGERLGFLLGQSIMVPKLEARLADLEKQEPIGWWAQYCETPMRRMVHWGAKLPECATDTFYPFYAAPVAQAGQVPEEWRDMLASLQWHYRDHDDHWHRPQGYYCPQCGGEQSKGHEKHCELADLLAAAPAQGGE